MQITNLNINRSDRNSKMVLPKGSSYKNMAFNAALGQYINPNVQTQQNQLITSLRPVLENGKNLAAGIEQAIKQAFPVIRFKIGNISDLKYPLVQKDKPIVFSRTSFKKEKPMTFLYLNFPAIINICNDRSAKQFDGLSESIADTIALANEPHYISDVINYCTDMALRVGNITLDSAKNIIDNCLKTFGIDIDNVVMDKKEVNIESAPEQTSYYPVTLVSRNKGNVETKLCLVFDGRGQDEIKKALSHEFTHTLNANSLWINDIFKELDSRQSAPIAQLDFGAAFQEIYKQDTNFLKRSVAKRGEIYEKMLKQMFETINSDSDKNLVFEQILTNVSDEALAYSKTPGVFQEYATPRVVDGQTLVSIPIG